MKNQRLIGSSIQAARRVRHGCSTVESDAVEIDWVDRSFGHTLYNLASETDHMVHSAVLQVYKLIAAILAHEALT